MSSGKLLRKLLDARDQRQDALSRAIGKGASATVFLSLNIPGIDKTPSGTAALFEWVLDQLSVIFPGIVTITRAADPLGPYAILAIDTDPVAVKERCISLEASQAAARLIDLDVYSAQGIQIDRSRLDLPRRRCLVCAQAAVECIRAKRHSIDEVIAKANELLAHFRT